MLDKYDRAYLIHADSEKEMNDWINTLVLVVCFIFFDFDCWQCLHDQRPNISLNVTNEDMKEFEDRKQEQLQAKCVLHFCFVIFLL